MIRYATKSYVITLRMYPNKNDLVVLNHRFNVVHHVTNVMVKHAQKCVKQLERDKTYNNLRYNYKTLSTNEKKELNDIRQKYGLSEFQFHDYIMKQKYMYNTHLDINTVQKIATKVWSATSKCLFNSDNYIRFKKNKDIKSFESKTNLSGIRYKDGFIFHNGLKIKTTYLKKDEYVKYALNNDRIKYCRIKRKWHKHNYRYYVDLVMEGNPPTWQACGQGTVGIDIGPSTIAVVNDNQCLFEPLAQNVTNIEQDIARLQRKLDRQRRTNNPDKYNDDGTIKKGSKHWKASNKQKLTQDKIKMLYQKRANQLRQDHINLANRILKLGDNIIAEDMDWAALAKKAKKTEKNDKGRYKKKKRLGKSIANHAPSMLINIIDQKLSYMNKKVHKVDCFKTAASKYNHLTGKLMNITIDDRIIKIGNYSIQRDLHAAFNLQHIIINGYNYTYDVNLMNKNFSNFITNHNNCIETLRQNKKAGHKYPTCIGI